MKNQILDLNGNPVVLNAHEERIANIVQKQVNNAGYEVDITTLTTIQKSIVEQKFYEIAFADFIPVKVGEGAWSQQLLVYTSQYTGGDFESGIINTSSNNGRNASGDAMIDSITVKVINWAKSMGWSLFDLQFASKSGNWDIVTQKQKSVKKNWDLGLQKIAFLGSSTLSSSVYGLLNQSGVTENTTTLTGFISGLSSSNFATFCSKVYQDYRKNCNYTARPTHFIIPEYDYNGLAAPYDPSFPIKTKLQALQEMFEMLTMNKNFKILPLAYANKSIQGTKNIYTLLNYDEDSIRMDIPVNFTNTLANSIDNFNFQSIAYGQFTGVKAYRPAEVLYFSHTASES